MIFPSGLTWLLSYHHHIHHNNFNYDHYHRGCINHYRRLYIYRHNFLSGVVRTRRWPGYDNDRQVTFIIMMSSFWPTLCSSCSSIMIMMSGRVGWKARARLVGGNPKLFLFQVQLRRPTTILLMIAHLGKIPTLRKTSLISAPICTNARASGQSNVFTKPKKTSQLYYAFNHTNLFLIRGDFKRS